MGMKEQTRTVQPGWPMLGILVAVLVVAVFLLIYSATRGQLAIIPGVVLVVDGFLFVGFFVVNPNEGRVLQLFGKYVGTVRKAGLRWANPLCTKRRVSLRVRNFETERSKVNDTNGNPIEIAAVVVWKVVDTAEAIFEVAHSNSFRSTAMARWASDRTVAGLTPNVSAISASGTSAK